MATSRIGAGNAAAAALSSGATQARTSTSVLLDAPVTSAHPGLAALAAQLHARARQLLGQGGGGEAWGPPGRLPAPGQYCFEGLQVARYTQGQHFLAHEVRAALCALCH